MSISKVAIPRWRNLPEEISDDIFLRLPAKSILVSRCVCKLFYNLLSKPNFIKNHVNRTIQSKSSPKLLCFADYDPPKIYSVRIDYTSISSSSSLSCEFDGAVLINYPFESNTTYLLNFLGSCNGIICLQINSYKIPYAGEGLVNGLTIDSYYCILNPLTREYKNFRPPKICLERVHRYTTYGFGYDNNNDDYKLVVISLFEEGGCFKIDVYTVKSDSWSSIRGTFNYSFRVPCQGFLFHRGGEGIHGVYFKGALHWLGSIANQKNSLDVIVSFNMSNETMVDMPLPEYMMPPIDFQGEMYSNLGVWGDCICIACIWGSVKIDLWVMHEYGVKESWIKKYTTTTTQELGHNGIPFWQLLWCFDNGEILVHNCYEHLLLHDPTNESVRSVVVRGITMKYSRQSYVESIVSIDSGTYLEKRITDKIVKNAE